MKHLIDALYRYSEYRKSDKFNSISATTIIGSLYKASLGLKSREQDETLVPLMYKRSSTIGTAVHNWAERAFKDNPDVIQELYRERQLELDGKLYVISGSCDLLEKQEDDTYTLADWKTGYGKERNATALDKDRLQMSIYRWLLQDEYDINDTAYSLFISQSNNAEEDLLTKHPRSCGY